MNFLHNCTDSVWTEAFLAVQCLGVHAFTAEWKWSRSVVSDSLRPPWTITYQAPLYIGFSRQEYWSGLPFPSPGDLPDPVIKPGSPTLQADTTVWATREAQLRHYYLQNDAGFITANDTTGVDTANGMTFFSLCPHQTFSPGGPPRSCSHTLISPSAVPLITRHPPPAVPCPSVSPIQISFVLQGALSWGQQAEDFWLHRFCVFRFQAQIVCTAHFSPSHAPLCFVIELVRVYVFTRWNKDSLKTGPSYLWCFTLQPHLKCFIYWPPLNILIL